MPQSNLDIIAAKPSPASVSARPQILGGGGGGGDDRRVLPFPLARLSGLAPALLAALLFASAFEARATDLTVNSAVTQVNNGVILDGDGKIEITNRGSITVNRSSTPLAAPLNGEPNTGIFLRGVDRTDPANPRPSPSSNNTITNNGTITVSGDFGEGIHVVDRTQGEKNTLINNGIIRASGLSAQGVVFSPNSTITNNRGAIIESLGNDASDAILMGPNSTINNDGRIRTNTNGGSSTIDISSAFLSTRISPSPGGEINNKANGEIIHDGNDGQAISIGFGITGFTINNAGEITANGTTNTSFGVHFNHNSANSKNTVNNSGTITTNGTEAHAVLFGSASLSSNNSTGNTLTNSGTITTNGRNASAVHGGSGNTIHNLKGGRIITTGRESEGINFRDKNKITNDGEIMTSLRSAEGINARDENEVTNNGNITTSGAESYGIDGFEDNTLINTEKGAITTRGNEAHGIRARSSNRVRHSGTITTGGNKAYGIKAGDASLLAGGRGKENEINSSGAITTSGAEAAGVWMTEDNTLDFSGRITTTGADAPGIQAGNDNTLTLNGAITTSNRNSHGVVTGTGTKLTIGANSRITTTGANSDGLRIGGLRAGSTALNQRGHIEANATGITAPYISRLENSGRIIGKTGDGVRLTGRAIGARVIIIISRTGDGVRLTAINPGTATVNNSGTIQGQTHGLNYGIYAITDLQNSGTIIGTTGAGVTFTGNTTQAATITNTGTIQGGTYGLNYGNNPIASLTNTSPRTLRGGSGEALRAGSLLTLNNSGTILSDRASAIRLTRTATQAADITNSGTIQGNIHGLDYNNNAIATLTNSGTIRGTTGIGVKAAGLATLNNTGTIEGQTGIHINRPGTLADGAASPAGATINNAGTLRSLKGASGTALDLQGPGRDTLKLQAGSTLEGQVRWDGQDDTLNLATGPARLTLIDNNAEPGQAPTPFTINTNGRPFLLNTTTSTARGQAQTTVTVLDPARIHTRTESTQSQWTGAVFQSLAQQQGARTGPNARNSTAAVHQTLWVRPFGGLHNFKRDGLTPAARYRYGGALAGYAVASTDWQAGGFVGAAQDTLAARGPGADAEGRHVFAGAYARTRWQALNLKAGLLFGQSRTETEWQRLNNQVTGGQERVVYEGRRYVVSPELGLATRLTVKGVALEPALSLRYLGLFGAEEDERLVAGREPLRFRAEDRHVGLVRASVGVPLRFPVNAYGGQLYGQLRVGAEGRKRFGGERIAARRGDGVVRFKVADEATVRGFMGAGFEYVVPDLNLSFSADLEASYGSEAVLGVQGQLGVVWGF